jgi:hypothetical protein
MAKRKQVAATEVEFTPTEETAQVDAKPAHAGAFAPQEAATATAVLERPRTEQAPRPLLADPFTFKTVNAGGTKVHFQHSRQAGEFQIRFGEGTRDDMPSAAVRDFIKSHKIDVVTRDGEEKQVQLFHWNDNDRAWGTRIQFKPDANDEERIAARESARQTAKAVFDDVVKLVAEERGNAASPSR